MPIFGSECEMIPILRSDCVRRRWCVVSVGFMPFISVCMCFGSVLVSIYLFYMLFWCKIRWLPGILVKCAKSCDLRHYLCFVCENVREYATLLRKCVKIGENLWSDVWMRVMRVICVVNVVLRRDLCPSVSESVSSVCRRDSCVWGWAAAWHAFGRCPPSLVRSWRCGRDRTCVPRVWVCPRAPLPPKSELPLYNVLKNPLRGLF